MPEYTINIPPFIDRILQMKAVELGKTCQETIVQHLLDLELRPQDGDSVYEITVRGDDDITLRAMAAKMPFTPLGSRASFTPAFLVRALVKFSLSVGSDTLVRLILESIEHEEYIGNTEE